ncbi:phage antirepressor KilAC domain-containing protein [Nonomuraea jabiensis]|uniref:phage antirepressor KilAC domain-containing protein n=1 Tax=Nonomuraea jabiensis TaxID=882448 RepID=UPI00341251A7
MYNTSTSTELALTEDSALRAKFASRVEVLDRVSPVHTLGDTEYVTTDLVAAYFDVDIETIKKLVQRHRTELETNGFAILAGQDRQEFLRDIESLYSGERRGRSMAVFTRRAVLNVAMLLRDSERARAIRTALLNMAEPHADDLLATEFVIDPTDTDGLLDRLEYQSHMTTQAISLARQAITRAEVAEKKAEQAELVVSFLEPKADAWEKLANAKGDYDAKRAADILSRDPAIEIGRTRLFAWLRSNGLINFSNRPYKKFSEYLTERMTSYEHPKTGDEMLRAQLRITARGMQYLHQQLGGVERLDLSE